MILRCYGDPLRTREGMAVTKAKGKLRGNELSPEQQIELRRMHATGDYSIADLAVNRGLPGADDKQDHSASSNGCDARVVIRG